MTEIRSLIADVDVAVVDPDLLWRVAHMNLLRDAVVRDFAAPEDALEALPPGRPAVLVLGPAAEGAHVALVVEAREARPELRTVHCVTLAAPSDETAGAAEDAEDSSGEAPDAGHEPRDGNERAPDGEGDGVSEIAEPLGGAPVDLVPETVGFDATFPDDGDEEAFIVRVEALLATARALDEIEPTEAVDGEGDDENDRSDEGEGEDAGGALAADPSRPAGADGGAGTGGPGGEAHRKAARHDLRPLPGLELPPRLAIVTSAKGGEGASTVALNLAHELASRAGVKTAIVDGDPFFGDVIMDMGAVPTRVPVAHELPLGEALLGQLVAFPASTAEPIVLRSPFPRDEAVTQGPDVLRTLLSVAGRIADVVIADVPLELLLTCPWLDQVAVVVLVTTPRTASLKNALVAAQRLSGSTNVGLVVNTIANHQRSSSAEEIAQAIALPLFGHLPSDGKMRRAATKAHPREIAEAHSHYFHAMTAVRRAVASHFPVLV